MARLESPLDWWTEVDDLWPRIQGIVNRVALYAGNVHDAWNMPGFTGSSDFDTGEATSRMRLREGEATMGEMFERMRRERDHVRLHDALSLVWETAPDHPLIHTWPGWGAFCDLLSEHQVCFEGGEG